MSGLPAVGEIWIVDDGWDAPPGPLIEEGDAVMIIERFDMQTSLHETFYDVNVLVRGGTRRIWMSKSSARIATSHVNAK